MIRLDHGRGTAARDGGLQKGKMCFLQDSEFTLAMARVCACLPGPCADIQENAP